MRLGLVLAIAACGSEASAPPDKDKPPPPSPSDGGVTVTVDAGSQAPSLDEIMAWMPKDVKGAWQGAWFTTLALRDAGMASYTGSYAALEITGTKAKVWVPATNKEYELEVRFEKPCEITFVRDGDYYRKRFVIENGEVTASGGNAGYRKGKAALICQHNDIFVLDDKGRCRKWTESFGKWTVEDTTCTWTDKLPIWMKIGKLSGTDALVVEKPDQRNEFAGRGDVLFDMFFVQGFVDHWKSIPDHRREPDFAAAKATAEKRWKETDAVELLKAAGAKPGETKTILDLWLTFKQDKAAIKGKPVTLSGKVLDPIAKRERDGKTEWVVVLVDPRAKDRSFQLPCRSPKEVKRAVGSIVKVSGTVAETSEPVLNECSVR